MNFKGTTIFGRKEIVETVTTGWENTPTDIEHLRLTCRGSDGSILKEFLEGAIDHMFEKDQG